MTDLNPALNQLGPGITEAQVLSAVDKSGYPLQAVVGNILRPTFHVQEEWSYVDRDSRELRNIDLMATHRLQNWDRQLQVRPELNILIECKQSKLPYVFFLAQDELHLLDFPPIAGLHHDGVSITSDDNPSTWKLAIPHALDLHVHDFQGAPPFSMSFSKCVRKGSDIQLSGSEAYNGLVLPLVKALEHFIKSQIPPKTALYFDAHLILAVGILDAPMVGVRVNEQGPGLEMVPWVRVLRHEYMDDSNKYENERIWALEIIHKDFFDQYLHEHLIPFAKCFGERALGHQTEVATGVGFAPGMGRDSFNSVEGRMQPRTVALRLRRGSAIRDRIVGLIRRESID